MLDLIVMALMTSLKQTARTIFALVVGFSVIYLGSIYIPAITLPLLYGPYPESGDVPFVRVFTDFWISFFFTVLGGFLSAKIAGIKPLQYAIIPGLLYFSLSAYWYSGYGLSGLDWIVPIFMLAKVLVGAYLGGYLCKKYSVSFDSEQNSE